MFGKIKTIIDGINYLSSTETNNIKNYNKIKHIRELTISEIHEEIYEDNEQELIIDWIIPRYKHSHNLDNWIGTSYLNYFINIERRSDLTKNSVRMITFNYGCYSYLDQNPDIDRSTS